MAFATSLNQEQVTTFSIQPEIAIGASIENAWAALLEMYGPTNTMPDGTPFPFKLEAWPGGRLLRDLGDNAGHLWAHVQVIKPPKLLELCGPLMMSYPAINHIQYRLTAGGSTTRLKLTHKAMGVLPAGYLDDMPEGMEWWLGRVKQLAETRGGKR